MVKVSGNQIITMNRGDYFSCPIYLNTGTKLEPEQYILQEDDELYFGVCDLL